MRSNNNRILFIHIPKCGGNTFNTILDNNYNPEERFDIKVVNNIKSNISDFHSLTQDQKDALRLVKGHQLFGLHSEFSTPSDYITFIRNPVERIVSYYYFVKRIPNHRLIQIGKFHDKMTLHDFVSEVDEADLHNGQIRYISGIKSSESEMLEISLSNIKNHFTFVGTLENFDESLVLLRRLYGWSAPYYRIKNKTKGRPTLFDVPDKTIDIIKEKNQGDIELYNQVSTYINSEINNDTSIPFEVAKIKTLSKGKYFVSDAVGKIKKVLK